VVKVASGENRRPLGRQMLQPVNGYFNAMRHEATAGPDRMRCETSCQRLGEARHAGSSSSGSAA
jgi:hypothetical protein